MNQIAITSFGHATVRLACDGSALVIDPGAFAPDAAFADVDAFLITHEHEDHADVQRVSAALASNPKAHVWAPQSVSERLTEAGTAADRIDVVTDGARFEAAGLTVKAAVGAHAEIHGSLPESTNVAYVIDNRILHPGDAFGDEPATDSLDVLFLPVSGPWMRFADAIDYVAARRPRVVIPIHDGDLNDVGLALTDQMSPALPGDGTYQRLPIAHPVMF